MFIFIYFLSIKDPSTAIPKGTILAIIITSLWYSIIAIICAGTTKRQATGSIDDLLNGTSLNCTIHKCTYGSQNDYQVNILFRDFQKIKKEAKNCYFGACSVGLQKYLFIYLFLM